MKRNLVAAAVAATTVWALAVGTASAMPAVALTPLSGRWLPSGATAVSSSTANQGLTTVIRAGAPTVITRGNASVAPDLAARGWNHIGDPGSVSGSVLDAYQTDRPVGAKLFTLTTASGSRSDYLHRLVPGEMSNNSFAAVAPGGRWFVSGEWGQLTRLLVFATPHPLAQPDPAHPLPLPLAATLELTYPVRNVQGCAFTSPTSLLCTTNDSGTDLYRLPRQVLTIVLTKPLDGHRVIGTPMLAGEVPGQSVCTGPAGEVEGLDVHGNRIVIAVNVPCAASTQLFSFIHARHRTDIDAATTWTQLTDPASGIRPERTNVQSSERTRS